MDEFIQEEQLFRGRLTGFLYLFFGSLQAFWTCLYRIILALLQSTFSHKMQWTRHSKQLLFLTNHRSGQKGEIFLLRNKFLV